MKSVKINPSMLDIEKIIESGQLFNYEIISSTTWLFKHKCYYVIIEQCDDGYLFYCDEGIFNQVWYPYFDLHRNYKSIQNKIIEIDPRLECMVDHFQGVRILQQDPFEMLITFILSQSKAIPQIRKLILTLSSTYGTKFADIHHLVEDRKIELYQFPTAKQLQHVDEAEFRRLKCGYRAPYLVDAIAFELRSPMESLAHLSNEQLYQQLISIKGVGRKVAACVMLFGFGRMQTFPVDTWMRKIMMQLYFPMEEKVNDKQIELFGLELFGDSAGIAQQYLFEYGRRKKSFKN